MSIFDFLNDGTLKGLSDYLIPAAIAGSAYVGSQASKDAARAQSQSAQASGDTQKEMFYKAREDTLPFMETGQQATFSLADLYGVPRPDGKGGFTDGRAFQGTPGYQFRLDQGMKAIDHGMGAGGMRFSGQRMKALSDYGQNTASEEFGNYTNSLRALAGMGQVSSSNTQGASGNAAAGIGNSLLAGGAARASGYTGGATAFNQGVGNALSYYGRPTSYNGMPLGYGR